LRVVPSSLHSTPRPNARRELHDCAFERLDAMLERPTLGLELGGAAGHADELVMEVGVRSHAVAARAHIIRSIASSISPK